MAQFYKHRDSVGICIDCGSTEEPLTDEHIIPYSLNGDIVLNKATCKKCQNEIGKIENEISRKYLLPVRTKLKYKTYNKKGRPTSFTAKIVDSNNQHKSTDIPAANYPASFTLPKLQRPTILLGQQPSNESGDVPFLHFYNITGIDQLVEGSESKKIIVNNSFNVNMFMRFIAKIAHGGLVSFVGLDGYISFLPDLILGNSLLYFHYIGSKDPEPSTYGDKPTVISIGFRAIPDSDDYFIVINIKNFLGIRHAPIYEIVAGRCDAKAFSGAPAQYHYTDKIQKRSADYSGSVPEPYHFKYEFNGIRWEIHRIDRKNVIREGNKIVILKFGALTKRKL